MNAPSDQWDRWIKVSEAAKVMRVPERTVRHWCATGQLPGRKLYGGSEWWIDLRSLKARRIDAQTGTLYHQLVSYVMEKHGKAGNEKPFRY